MFDSDKAVLFFRPQGRLAFVGGVDRHGRVVTGLNEEGIYVSVNALRTMTRAITGCPSSFCCAMSWSVRIPG